MTAFGILLSLLFSTLADTAKPLTVTAISHESNFSDAGRAVRFEWVEITQVVEAEGKRYTLSCSGVAFRSAVYKYCEWLHFDGDQFQAEIKGKDMIIHARSGGNQGKEIKLKFRITDIRDL